MAITVNKPALQQIYIPEENTRNLWLLRLDAVHEKVSGNKWFKLQYYLQEALENGCQGVASMGGGWSNHLAALAEAAALLGLQSLGFVRGQYPQPTATMKACAKAGMILLPQTIAAYEHLKYNNAQEHLPPNFYWIPEGGDGPLGVKGAATIANYIPKDAQKITVSVGSGTTLAGLLQVLPHEIEVYGFAPMKGGVYLQEKIQHQYQIQRQFQIFDEWNFGGFGKVNESVLSFAAQFEQLNNIKLDYVYTAKMMMGVQDLLKRGIWHGDAKIICIHTGGIQGNVSRKM